MSFVFYLLILLVYAGALGLLATKLAGKHVSVGRQQNANLETAQGELATKTAILEELAQLTLGLVDQNEFDALGAKLAEAEEAIRAERGRLTITEAELEAVDTRLRELEELKRELEVSNMDAVKELEMLRSQERDIRGKNEALRNQLKSSVDQLDLLLDMLASSAEVVARLTGAKNELIQTEEKCIFYEQQIAVINNQYMTLKKAYDALDIEYAQLYEKQQSAEVG